MALHRAGQPMQKSYFGSFNGRVRDILEWVEDYNTATSLSSPGCRDCPKESVPLIRPGNEGFGAVAGNPIGAKVSR